MMQAILNAAYPLSAIVYLLSMQGPSYPGHALVKAVPILLLAAIVFSRTERSPARLLFGIGLLFSAAGDIALASRFPLYFVIGLSLFLVAQIFYAISFHRRPRARFQERALPLGLVLFVVVATAALVLPRTGALLVPVTGYILAISTMGILAAVQKEDAPALFTGALLFILSDGIIAMNKFVVTIPQSGILIMTTYYLAQLLLTRGMLGISRARPAR